MNLIALIIATAMVIELLVEVIADVLNLSRLKSELPPQLQGFYDPEGYRKSQEYLRATTRFGWVVSLFNILALLAFWFGKGSLCWTAW